jgi:hypothetical protein
MLLGLLVGKTGEAAIPQEEGACLHKEVQARTLTFYQRQLTEHFARRHDEAQPRYEEAVAFIGQMIERQMQAKDYQELLPFRKQAEELRKAFGDDGALQFIEGVTSSYYAAWAADRFRLAADALAEQGYPLAIQVIARNRSSSDFIAIRRVEEGREQLQEARALLVRYLASEEGRVDVEEAYTLVAESLLFPRKRVDEDLTAFVAFIVELSGIGTMDPWLKHMIIGESSMTHARFVRGGGWASEVPEEAWPVFEQKRAAGRRHLIEAHRLKPRNPAAAIAMVQASWGGVGADREQDPRFWFDEAVRAEFDAMPAYRLMSFALLPRWGGSHEAFMAFAEECANTERFDTQVPYYAIEAIHEIVTRDLKDDYRALERFGGFDLAKRVLCGYAERTDGADHWAYLSELFIFTSLMDKPAEAAGIWARLDGHFDNGVVERFPRLGHFDPADVDRILSRADTAGAVLLAQAMQAEQTGRYDEAQGLYEQVRARSGDSATESAQRRQAISGLMCLRWKRDGMAGRWVALTFDEGLAGWTPRFGTWRAIDDRTVEGHSGKEGLLLQLNTEMGTRFELRGRMAFTKQVYPQYFSGGIVLYDPERVPAWNPSGFHGLLLFRDRQTVVRFDPSSKAVDVASLVVAEVNDFHLRVVDGQARLEVNGERVWEGAWFEDEVWLKRAPVGFGGHYWYEGAALRFSDLEVRAVPKPDEAESEL